MAKKQKKAIPERTPTKRQLSKWQREDKMRRIVIIVAIVLLVGIAIWVGIGSARDYKARTAAWREVVLEVNDVPFTMKYFVKMLDVYTVSMNSSILYSYGEYFAGVVADEIIEAELLRQGAKNLSITVTAEEISARLKASGLPDNETYRGIFSATLSQEKLEEYFGSNLTGTMEQAHVEVICVESEEIADEVISRIEAGGNFTALVEEFSCNSTVEGDLGWLPRELMPNTLIADAAFNITPGEVSEPLKNGLAQNASVYWVVKVIDRGDHELEEKVKEELIDKHFNDWFEEWKQNSTIENLLDKEKKTWAVNEVLKGR